MQQRLSAEVIKRLMKKYRKNPGAKVGSSKQIQQMLAKGTRVGDPKKIAKMLKAGTKISTFMKKGGHVRKKTKKKK